MSEIGTYTITVDEARKNIRIDVEGTFDDNKAEEFHNHYLSKILPIETTEYVLILNSLDMDVISREMLPKLQVTFALYRKSNYKEICFIILNDEIRQQVKKVISFSGITDISDISFILPEDVESKIEQHLNSI